MVRLPTSYFTRFDVNPEFKEGIAYSHYKLRKPTFSYKFNVLLEQSDPILDLRTPSHCQLHQETFSSNSINLSFESLSDVFTHDVLIFFQTPALGRTDVYTQSKHPGLLALMLQRSHLPIFKPHLPQNYQVPHILKGLRPPRASYSDAEPGKFVFLLDRSGSMSGRMSLARQALRVFLQSLPAESEF